MGIETFWLDAKPPVPGLDHVGIRSTSIRLYNHLVPGITNVTDRVRYYSIHAYAVDLWATEVATTDLPALRRFVRRIECVLGLAEKIRLLGTDHPSPGIVGTNRFSRWLRDCPSPLPSNLRIPLDQIEVDYFQNRWGAFGQYYSGSEEALGIIGWRDGIPRLVDPLGRQLAEAFRRSAEKVRLRDLLKERAVTVSHLRRVGAALGFDSLNEAERNLLRGTLLDTSGSYGPQGTRRRNSLLLLLSAANQLNAPMNEGCVP